MMTMAHASPPHASFLLRGPDAPMCVCTRARACVWRCERVVRAGAVCGARNGPLNHGVGRVKEDRVGARYGAVEKAEVPEARGAVHGGGDEVEVAGGGAEAQAGDA